MSKRTRQYLGIIMAIVCYYLVHEGAHFLLAMKYHAYRAVRFMGLGMQVDIYRERLTDSQLGIFCIVGPIATLICAYILVALSGRICSLESNVIKAIFYYVTIIMLVLDPIYLSVLCGFFGGGDMNGIAMLMPEIIARLIWGILLFINLIMLLKLITPRYSESFAK